MSVIWRKTLRDLAANKARTALVVISTAVGVFALGLVFGLEFIDDSLRYPEEVTELCQAALKRLPKATGGMAYVSEALIDLLERAERERQRERSETVELAHLLHALAQEIRGPAGEILQALGIGPGGCAMLGQFIINVRSAGQRRLSVIAAALFLLSFIIIGLLNFIVLDQFRSDGWRPRGVKFHCRFIDRFCLLRLHIERPEIGSGLLVP